MLVRQQTDMCVTVTREEPIFQEKREGGTLYSCERGNFLHASCSREHRETGGFSLIYKEYQVNELYYTVCFVFLWLLIACQVFGIPHTSSSW